MNRMSQETRANPNEPTEPVRRSPLDVVWFTILFLSIATGVGMTLFAPVGDTPPPAPALAPVPAPTLPPTTIPSTLPTP
jgi:hypothetical protein